MPHRKSQPVGSQSKPCVVGNERVRIIPERERRRQVNRIQRAQVRILERRGLREHRFIGSNEHERREHRIGARMCGSRRTRAPQSPVYLNTSESGRDAIGPTGKRLYERIRLRFDDDELDDRRGIEIGRQETHRRACRP